MSTAATKPKTDLADHPSGDPRFKLVDRAIKKFDHRGDALLEVLNTAQEVFGFLSEDLLIYVSQQLRAPLARVYGVATFYHLFSFKPLGEHVCIICQGTACYVKGADAIQAALEQEFGIQAGQTTPDGKLSLSTARCLGCCGLAPVLVVDGGVAAKETPATSISRLRAQLQGAAMSAAQPETETS